MHIANILVLATLAAAPTRALDINCSGIASCTNRDDLQTLAGYVSNIDPNRQYSDGIHIACHSDVCVFLQGTKNGAPGSAIPGLMKRLADHGCKSCGNVPLDLNNDPAAGVLTVNVVVDTGVCKNQLCP